MRTLALTLLALLPAPAFAGGFGLTLGAGPHYDTVYAYTEKANGDVTQDKHGQIAAQGLGGVEVILGDRDNSVLGVFRATFSVDTPQRKPETGISTVRDTMRPVGRLTAGLQWGVSGDPDGTQTIVVANAGAGLFTSDRTEFALAEVGAGRSWMATEALQVHATGTFGLRYRKSFQPEVNVVAGVRYLFD
ncbi:MAG: hypothetical protein RLZZ299_160 [Pseudomonadota bacterium]|jgi:hypothetical protein